MLILVLFERKALKILRKIVKSSKSSKQEACNSEHMDVQLRRYNLHLIRF